MKTSCFLYYGRWFYTIVIGLILISIGFCYRVDPFSVYGRIYSKDGQKVNSPGFTSQLHMGKAIAVERYQPSVIIMGSSRSAFGIARASAEKYFPNQKVYNLAFPAASAYETLRYFQHAVASSDIKQAFIGLDFFQYHGGRALPNAFREERLAVDVNNQPTQHSLNDFLSTLVSTDAVFYSIKVATGLCNWNDIYFINGFQFQNRESGWLNTFLASEKKYIDNTYTIPDFTFANKNKSGTTFDYFRKIVQLAHQQHIALHFFISPSHARQWEVIAQLGLWKKWEYWKQKMLTITDQEARLFQQTAFPIYDFSGYSAYATERVPRTNKQRMQWYSDSSHYQHAIGDILFAIMVTAGTRQDSSFGRELSAQNIKQHLADIRAKHQQYQLTHPQDEEDIQQLIAAQEKY